MVSDQHIPVTRRRYLTILASSALLATPAKHASISFVFGTYGMKGLSTADALRHVARIGYDGVELCLLGDWPTNPAKMSAEDIRQLRTLLQDLNLSLPVVLESLPLTGTPEKRAWNLDRLKRAADMLHQLDLKQMPVLDTVLGLKASDWDAARPRMVDELREWSRVAEDTGMTIGIKPHTAQAVNNAARTLTLLREVRSPRLRVIYDYSHFHVEGFGLEQSLRELFPQTAAISVKDSVGTPDAHDFLLPGDGDTDYPAYFRLLRELGYNGAVGVEVSALIHRKPNYEPVAAAQHCYTRLAPLIAASGLRRVRR